MIREELEAALKGIGRPRILVVGDLILDRYVSGEVGRISPEAPIPILAAKSAEDRLGGAGNVVSNLRTLEAEVDAVGVVGDDGRGRMLREMLEAMGVATDGCIVDGSRPTTEKTRMTSGVQQMLRVDWEVSRPVGADIEAEVVRSLPERVGGAQAVVLSDYGKGLLTPRVLEAVIRAGREVGVPVLVDPKGRDFSRYRGATLITPNRREAEEALGRGFADLEDIARGASELLAQAELGGVVITLGAEGMYYQDAAGDRGRVPTFARAVFDVTGAGDTVISNLALALAAGLRLEVAVHLANHAAGLVVGRRGAAAVSRSEILAALDVSPQSWGKVLAPAELDPVLAEWRQRGRRIAFTNGCFDVIHVGHIDYLRFARSKGDVLLVGVNDDDSVRRLKGPERPLNRLEDRCQVLAALEMVDAVVPFGEDTPAEIIQRVTPDALIKGEDWAEKGVVGREWVESHGGQVYLAPLVPGRSTTAIVERLRSGGGPAAE